MNIRAPLRMFMPIRISQGRAIRILHPTTTRTPGVFPFVLSW